MRKKISSRRIIRSLKAEADAKRTFFERLADTLTYLFGSIIFLLLNVVFFAVWIVINVNLIPGLEAFDPYPFSLLTTFVSLEAIMLAIVVLISQNRGSKVDDFREEVDLQVDIITEQEITKLMTMVQMLLEKQGISIENDPELQEMLKPTNIHKIKKILEREVEENGSL